jgi:undecaprenyl-diphosphatase
MPEMLLINATVARIYLLLYVRAKISFTHEFSIFTPACLAYLNMILLESGVHSGLRQSILRGDYWLFTRINQKWTSPSLDIFFLFIREAELWVPLYLFLLVFGLLNFKKKGAWWAFGLIMTGIASDTVSSHLIKHFVYRLRPCQNPALADTVRSIANYCPLNSSFTSSHACNHFAAATFIIVTLQHTSRWWWLFYGWAAAICYAQVYVGVHFPTDVLGGAIVGILIGLATSRIFHFQAGRLPLPSNTPYHA